MENSTVDAKSGSLSRSSANESRLLWRRRLAFIAGIGLGILLAQAWQILDYSKHLMQTPNAEYAIILGARTEGDQATPLFEERIQAGLDLYHEGKVKKLLFTGQPGEPPQALVARRIALEAGVPEQDILVEIRSRRTLENLRYARELLPDGATVLIVSDPLHLKRAMLMAGDLGLVAAPAPATATRVRGLTSRMRFLFRETLATLYYRVERWF